MQPQQNRRPLPSPPRQQRRKQLDEAVKNAADIPLLATAYDGINIKLMKAGGLQEALRMIQMAKALNMKIMLGCMIESSIAITAAAHLSPLVDYADLDGNLLRKIRKEYNPIKYPVEFVRWSCLH